MNYTYLPHTDFKYRFSKACKKANRNCSSSLDTFKLLPIEGIMRLWCPLPSAAFATVARYLWDIFVTYSRFVGRNCQYIAPSDK